MSMKAKTGVKQDKKGVRKKEKMDIRLEYDMKLTEVENKFFSSLKSKDLKAIRCPKCHKVIFPPTDYCPYCREKTKSGKWVNIPNIGKVISQTTVHYSYNPNFPSPYSILAIKIPKTDSILILPSKNTGIYLGDRVRISVKGKREFNITDIEVENMSS